MQRNNVMPRRFMQNTRLVSLLIVLALVLSSCDMFGGSSQSNNTTQNNSSQNTPSTNSNTTTGSTSANGSAGGTMVASSNSNAPAGSDNATQVPPTDTSAPPTDTPATKVSVKVNNAWDGSVVTNASIAVQQGSNPVNASTDGNGEYTFDNLAAGAVATVSAPGYADATNVKLNAGVNTVSLMPDTIHGKVTDATTGKPLVNVMVRAYPSDAPAAPMTDTAPVQATPTITSSYNYGGRPFAAPLLTDTTSVSDTTTTTPTQDLGYVSVFGTGGDGLWLAAQPKHGADHVRLLHEGDVLKVTGADIPGDSFAWVPVQTTDSSADKGYAARPYVIASAAPGAPTFTPPPPPTATPTATPPPPATLLQQPITTSNLITFTDANGNYTLHGVPANPVLHFKYSGYELTQVPTNHEMVKDVALKQFHVHALYYTAEWAASSDLMDQSLKMIQSKDINSIVLNVQDNGSIALVYSSTIPLAKEVGHAAYFDDLPGFIKKLHDQYHLYVIARVVCFVEPGLVNNRPDLAVKSQVTGRPIVGGLGQEWLDPTNPDSVKHILSIINEVKGMGFDEVQLDYMRFLSDTPASQGDPIFKAGDGNDIPWQTKAQYVESFVSQAYELTRYTDTFLSGDVFGYILWPDQAEGPVNRNIGQIWEYVIKHLDYVSPMIYPSHFSPGEQGFSVPNDHPYEIIKAANKYAQERLASTGDNFAKYRPWLQYFTLNGNLLYTGPVVRLQTKATNEDGVWGWLMWDASNEYQYPDAFDARK